MYLVTTAHGPAFNTYLRKSKFWLGASKGIRLGLITELHTRVSVVIVLMKNDPRVLKISDAQQMRPYHAATKLPMQISMCRPASAETSAYFLLGTFGAKPTHALCSKATGVGIFSLRKYLPGKVSRLFFSIRVFEVLYT